jgi:hypothetical protein
VVVVVVASASAVDRAGGATVNAKVRPGGFVWLYGGAEIGTVHSRSNSIDFEVSAGLANNALVQREAP